MSSGSGTLRKIWPLESAAGGTRGPDFFWSVCCISYLVIIISIERSRPCKWRRLTLNLSMTGQCSARGRWTSDVQMSKFRSAIDPRFREQIEMNQCGVSVSHHYWSLASDKTAWLFACKLWLHRSVLSVCLFVCLFVCLSVCLSFCLWAG